MTSSLISSPYVCSIDIGKKNFALTVEEIDQQALSEINDLSENLKYNSDGTLTSAFQEIINKVYQSGKIVYTNNHDLTQNTTSSKYLDREIFYNMNALLESLSAEYLEKCLFVIVEQQMAFGKMHNTMALKLGQHCQSFFILKFGRKQTVIEFPSYHKTQVLGAQKIKTTTKSGLVRYKPIDKPARKKWSVAETRKLLTLRNDLQTLQLLDGGGVVKDTSDKKKKKTKKVKADDISDTILQLQAWKYLTFVKK